MNKKKLISVALLVVTGVFSMWARYASQKAEQRKREALFRQLSTYSTLPSAAPSTEAPAESPAPAEPRSVFDSALPQELFELVRQTVGSDFKLMELRLNEDLNTFTLSTDGKTVQ